MSVGRAFEAEGREGAMSLGVARCLICLRLSKINTGCENKVRAKEMNWERKAAVEEANGLLQR